MRQGGGTPRGTYGFIKRLEAPRASVLVRMDQRTLFRSAGPRARADGDEVERVPAVREAREERDARRHVDGLVRGVPVGAEGGVEGGGSGCRRVEGDRAGRVVDELHRGGRRVDRERGPGRGE